jgi:hypothetical protein
MVQLPQFAPWQFVLGLGAASRDSSLGSVAKIDENPPRNTPWPSTVMDANKHGFETGLVHANEVALDALQLASVELLEVSPAQFLFWLGSAAFFAIATVN